MTVNVYDLDNLGAVLDKSVSVGANSINGVAFAVSDPASCSTRRAKKP